GLRNPFRFTIDPFLGDLFIGDVGEDTWEEVDQLKYNGFVGANYGWPEFEGPLEDPVPDSTDCSIGPFQPPIYAYVHDPVLPNSVICGPLYRGPATSRGSFPPEYEGSLFLSEFFSGWIRRLQFDGTSWSIAPAVSGQPDSLDWATGLPRIADFQE